MTEKLRSFEFAWQPSMHAYLGRFPVNQQNRYRQHCKWKSVVDWQLNNIGGSRGGGGYGGCNTPPPPLNLKKKREEKKKKKIEENPIEKKKKRKS